MRLWVGSLALIIVIIGIVCWHTDDLNVIEVQGLVQPAARLVLLLHCLQMVQ